MTAPPALKTAKANMAIVYFTPVVIAIGKVKTGSHKCENHSENGMKINRIIGSEPVH